MTTWGLLGGPQNGELGEGDVPPGYEFEGAGQDYGWQFDSSIRERDAVYRWGDDARDIRDGHRLLDGIQDGSIQFGEPATAEWVNHAFSAFQQTLFILKDMPESDEAQMARDSVALYREKGLI